MWKDSHGWRGTEFRHQLLRLRAYQLIAGGVQAIRSLLDLVMFSQVERSMAMSSGVGEGMSRAAIAPCSSRSVAAIDSAAPPFDR